jgi:hypothetical protein
MRLDRHLRIILHSLPLISDNMFNIQKFKHQYIAQVPSWHYVASRTCSVRNTLFVLFFWKLRFQISVASHNLRLMVPSILPALNDKIRAVSVNWLIHDNFVNVCITFSTYEFIGVKLLTAKTAFFRLSGANISPILGTTFLLFMPIFWLMTSSLLTNILSES